ncbi:RING finger protein 145-like [Falco rusticolus]|uniref:RING finger protein 145-like n=1 Tax=Falco rusticolus TaxID=120794 RepID=UPI0018866AAC|nr:RING finger protein 145-like [Falco rusticolus]XP_055558975.1 RING finger protein 145-like isoform X1 [Falco cherrug]
MARLEAVANVALRVPGLALLDLLYRWDAAAIGELLRPRRGDPQLLRAPALRAAHCLGHLLCVVVLVLPVRSLVKLYLHLLTGLLLGVGHTVARDFVRQELEYGFQGAVYSDPVALSSFATTLASQLCLCALCSLLMRSRQPWLFGAPLLPVLARLCGLPLHVLPVLNTFAATLTAMEVLYILGSHILVPFQLAAAACREIAQAVEVYRLVALGMSLWSQLAIPLLFLVFWLVLFFLQLSSFLASSSSPLAQQGLLFLLLSSAAECCGTPYSLIGLTFTVSYLALGVLNLCKFYLLGFGAFQNGNVMHRGVTEGVTLLLLALQTGLLDLQILQRTFLLSIILFIVVTSTLQSMIEIADPIVLALGASRNRSPWKHFRGVSMCLFLLVFPCFMAYKIAHFFHLDFWLLILVSSCMLTSLQVMGTLFIYALFMVELLQDTPLERMDEIIYCVNAVSRVLEFLVAVCVVGYGTWESLFGEWSWMGASVIIIHSYFNVWLRAQSGWRSFLLRREAAKKINSLPRATGGQLQDHNDVCAICFQDMQVAVVTPCNHFFHAACLRKWLYVQDTCPMCHQQVTPVAAEEDPSTGRAARPAPSGGDEVPEDRGAATSPALARPQQDGLLSGDSVVTGQGDSKATQNNAAEDHSPHHPDTSAPWDREMGAVLQPRGDPPPSVQDTQHLSPPPTSLDPFVSPKLGAGDSRDTHSGHRPS